MINARNCQPASLATETSLMPRRGLHPATNALLSLLSADGSRAGFLWYPIVRSSVSPTKVHEEMRSRHKAFLCGCPTLAFNEGYSKFAGLGLETL